MIQNPKVLSVFVARSDFLASSLIFLVVMQYN